MGFPFAVVVADVAMRHKQRRTVVAAEKTVGHIVDSIDDRHCNLVERLLVQLKAVRMLGILVSLLQANHEADLLPFLRAVVVMPSFLNLLVHLVSFRAMMLLH